MARGEGVRVSVTFAVSFAWMGRRGLQGSGSGVRDEVDADRC